MLVWLKEVFTDFSLPKTLLWILIIIPGIPFGAGSVGFLGYVFWPRDLAAVIDTPQLQISPTTSRLTIAAHGVKDSPTSWSDGLGEIVTGANKSNSQFVSLDWQTLSNNPFICSVAGRRIGAAIGERLAQSKQLHTVHAVGHSCGAFVALGICEGARLHGAQFKFHTTFLDPVSVYAGFWWDFGIEQFGSCADFSDAYIDSRDGVPGSNQLLPNTHTFDVTLLGLQQAPQVSPHVWPTHYYLRASAQADVPVMDNGSKSLWQRYPRGVLTTLSADRVE